MNSLLSSPLRAPIAALGLGLSLTVTGVLPTSAKPTPQPAAIANQAIRGLTKLFSPDIQKTIGACLDQGKVNLAAGADQDGSVICGNGTRDLPVQFDTYVETYSTVLAASGLIALQKTLKSNPQVRPEIVLRAANTPYGKQRLRNELRKVMVDAELVAKNSPKSATFLADRVIERAQPLLKDPRTLNSLLGSKEQYAQVVQSFCKPPGMTIDGAKALVPDLQPVQLYAICIQESGLAEEIQGKIK